MKYYVMAEECRRMGNGLIPVNILFKEGSHRFLVGTGLTSSVKFSGLAFPSSERNARAKTRRLVDIVDAVEKCLLESHDVGRDELKRRLRMVVSDEEQKRSVKTAADYVMDYAQTKKNAGTRGLYEATARKICSFDHTAVLDSIDMAWLDGWTAANADMSVNGFGIHLRNLRTVFNWAIDNDWTKNYPFRRYDIRSEKVAINNITVEQLRAVRDYPLDDWRAIYRDLFMLTFYLCGINPVDLLHLKHGDMKNGRIRYRRAKTGRLYDIPVPVEAEAIISRYRGKDWLLCPLDRYAYYKNFTARWNGALKKIGGVDIVPDKVGKMRKIVYRPIVEGMTIYTARYTFASLGAELDIPRETIGLCLGHAWTDVTSHYISYDNKKIDAAVRRIIDYVNG